MAKKSNRPQPNPIKPTQDAPPATPAPVEPPAQAKRSFFTPEDWIAAGTTFLISGAAFMYFMSPEVTLEDSGELVTGAFNFGVSHPPGYPLWAFLGWVWRHLVPFGNPAWRICLMSVLTGALVVGVLTLLMTRSILMILRAVTWADSLEEKMKHWIALTVGAAIALLFGFNRGVWLWACVPEMRVLNVFMFILTACIFFAWMMRPERHAYLYATILIYGLGISNHQTIAVMGLPLVVGAFLVGLQVLWESDAHDYRASVVMKAMQPFSEAVVALLFSAMGGFLFWAWLESGAAAEEFTWRGVAAGVVGAVLLAGLASQRWLNWKRALICTACFLLGCGFYFYMPVSASTNPPMNWGYTATKQGFLHHITRGQYEKLNVASPFSKDFFVQIYLFVRALLQQMSPRLNIEVDYFLGLPIAVFALVTVVILIRSWKDLRPRAKSWLIFVWAAFLTTGFGLLTIINPGLDKQNQEINIKFFAPAHGFYCMLIGYGLALAVWKDFPRGIVRTGCVLLLVLPLLPLQRNWETCDFRGRDFGYQFGYRMFYPGTGYEPMDKDAVLFGGTDPGRFVPTYMILAESRVRPDNRFRDRHLDPEGGRNFDRRDVYIITQNALADNTYMSYIRDHYDYSRPNPNDPKTLENFLPWQRALFYWGWTHLGRNTTYPREPIYIPTETDLQRAFQEYVRGVQEKKNSGQQPGPDENVEVDAAGRVSVRGVGGVMAINGILTNWIFQRNKDKHAFYVEESYVIPWMYPYMTPYGIILKINHDTLPPPSQDPQLWKQIVDRDTAYWDKLCAEFAGRREFYRDTDAQKTFSKLRSAIGGLYAYHHMVPQAEYAFKQALNLCPESPEANFRLAQLYIEQGRVDDALAVLQALQKLDPLNTKITQAISQLSGMKQQHTDSEQIEQAYAAAPRDANLLTQLAQAYYKSGQGDKIIPLCERYLSQTNLPVSEMMQVCQIYVSLNQIDRAITTLQAIVSEHPKESQPYFAIAIIRSAQGKTDESLDALEKAIQFNPGMRNQARNNPQLNNLRNNPRFQALVGSPPPNT